MCEPVHDYKTDEEDMTPVNLPRKSDVQRQFEHTMEVHGFVEKSKGTNVPVPDEQKHKLSIDWSQVPSEFKWAAMDANGRVWVFSCKPVKMSDCFDHNPNLGTAQYIGTAPCSDDWRDSLTERPEEPAVKQPAQATANKRPHTIELSAQEIQSGLDRVKWAESLIKQLPESHDGRNSWLLNYGTKEVKPEVTSPLTDDEIADIYGMPSGTPTRFGRKIAIAAKIATLKEVAAMPSVTSMDSKALGMIVYDYASAPKCYTAVANAAIAEFQKRLLKQLGE